MTGPAMRESRDCHINQSAGLSEAEPSKRDETEMTKIRPQPRIECGASSSPYPVEEGIVHSLVGMCNGLWQREPRLAQAATQDLNFRYSYRECAA